MKWSFPATPRRSQRRDSSSISKSKDASCVARFPSATGTAIPSKSSIKWWARVRPPCRKWRRDRRWMSLRDSATASIRQNPARRRSSWAAESVRRRWSGFANGWRRKEASHGRARLCFAGGCLLRGQVPLSWRGCPYRNGGRQLRRAWLCNRRDGGHGRFVFLCLRADPDAARRLGCIALGRTAQLRGAHGAAASAPVWAAPAKRNMGTRESAGTVRC